MKTQKEIQEKFAKISSVLNIITYIYIALLVILLIAGIVFAFFIELNPVLIFTDLTLFLMFLFTGIFVGGYFVAVFILLSMLKKLVSNIQQGNIFTEENKKRIQKLFILSAILLSILFLVISGGIFVLFAMVFLWVLYEIFFIWFDYKIQNDILKEESDLTI